MRWIRYHYGCTCPLHQLQLAEELDLDSMDLQELRAALHERTGVDLGGVAAEQLATLGGLITALVSSGS